MIISLLVGAVSSLVVDSVIAGVTLGTTVYCCSRGVRNPSGTKRK